MTVYKIAGIRPISIGLLVMRGTERPILSGTRDRTLTIPGRVGAWDYGADLDVKNFSLNCRFIAKSPAELQYSAETLARLLIDSYGKPRTFDLSFEDHPDRTYKVRYSGSLSIERLVGMGDFSLPLTAFDPFAYGPQKLQELIITQSPQVISVRSEGDIRAAPEIILTNTGTTTIRRFRIANEYLVE
ncbi:phage tail family protein [Paenibacillus sp. P96]|uniref:Phage tail family protein n=1 Tax=Paenibacillus zeirhizosphaerae TaxID=2987519 RepID=A0ABT9FL70_9BACL|nr:distal tail protein Dit [Paenibacillus sp. P96]MDP4095477.1 phage tail family protein [Paenibacillus sp. P96]